MANEPFGLFTVQEIAAYTLQTQVAIDNSDWQTKRALTAVIFFCTLADAGSHKNLPLIAIPAQ